MKYLLVGILYITAYAALDWVFGGDPRVQSIYGNAGLLLPVVATCLVILRRRREWLGVQRLFWDAFLLGLTLWMLGHIGWVISQIGLSRPAWVQWHTMFSLVGGLGPLVAFLARPHRGAREGTAGATTVDLVSFGAFGAFIYAYFVLVPSVVLRSGNNSEGVLLGLVQVQRLVLLTAAIAALWVGRRSAWAPTYLKIAVGVFIGFFLRIGTSVAIAQGSYHLGSLFDLAWIFPFLCFLWAALTTPASSRDDIPLEAPVEGSSALLSAVPMLLVPMVGYGLLRVHPLGDPGDSFRVLLTTMTTVAGVGLLTLRLAVQRVELQRADARLRLLAAATEQTADLILITRQDGTFEHGNDACLRALGYTRSELIGMNLADLLDQGGAELRDQIRDEVRLKGIWRGTLVHRRRDGSTFPASSTVVALRDPGGSVTHFVGVQRDVTEELRLRDQLVHSERLSAAGELVAGVAHEINNPLQTIVGCVELLLEERASLEEQHRDLQLVRQEAARAGQIVRNLLAFVRRGSPDRVNADLNQIVRATADLREYHLVQSNITLAVDLQPDPLPVLVNREEIQQVVLNLMMNAEQAIAESSGSGTIIARTLSEDGFQKLRVSDDGPGISADLRGRIFEPFFTTKEVGQGTGLGLSISLGIATSHGGLLKLCEPSKASKGACFELSLPAAVAATTPARPVSTPQPAAGRGSKVLVVEDEAPIRGLLIRLLSRRGFEVVEAAGVKQALTLIESQAFDLVLCDVALGDGSGVDYYRQVRTILPELAQRFVFVTGNAGSVPQDAELAGVPVLTKPFTAADLDRLVEGIVAGPSSLIVNP